MKPSCGAVIFDWNGTVVADARLTVNALNKTLAAFRAGPVSLADYREEFSVPLIHMYKKFGCDEEEMQRRQSELFGIFEAHYEKNKNTLRLRKGARCALGELKARGHKTAVLSNYKTARILDLAKKLKIEGQFDEILANDENTGIFFKKSKGERLKDFIEKHETKQALVVGDTPEEVEIAHAHGFLGVAVTDGFCSLARLRAAKPDFLVTNLGEVPDIAARVFGKGGR